MEKITAYKCQYCGKIFETLEKGHLHEEYGCRKNKSAFNCNDCMWVIGGNKFGGKTKCGKGHKISYKQFSICRDKKLEWK